MAVTQKAGRNETDAIALLKADHKAVKALFKKFTALKDDNEVESEDAKGDVVQQICISLSIHAAIEEEIFYPAVREAIDEPELVDEAVVEHAEAKDLIAQLQAMDAEDDLYDAKVTVLGEQIDHHVQEEEDEMFPKAKKAKLDLEALGASMAARKEQLGAEMGVDLLDDAIRQSTQSKRPEARRR